MCTVYKIIKHERKIHNYTMFNAWSEAHHMMDRSLVTLCKLQMVTLKLIEVRGPVQRVHYMNKIVIEHVAVTCAASFLPTAWRVTQSSLIQCSKNCEIIVHFKKQISHTILSRQDAFSWIRAVFFKTLNLITCSDFTYDNNTMSLSMYFFTAKI